MRKIKLSVAHLDRPTPAIYKRVRHNSGSRKRTKTVRCRPRQRLQTQGDFELRNARWKHPPKTPLNIAQTAFNRIACNIQRVRRGRDIAVTHKISVECLARLLTPDTQIFQGRKIV